MSESKQEDSITVLSGTDPPIILPIENYTLTLECLTTYFPNANGLVWTDQTGRCHGLKIKNGQMSIIPQIRTYTVRWAKSQEKSSDTSKISSSSSSSSNANSESSGIVQAADSAKLERINFYRRVIEGKDTGDVPPIMSKLNKVSETKDGRSKISDLRKAQKQQKSCAVPKVKYVNIGWKHRRIGQKKYLQRKNIKNGNSRELALDVSQVYTVSDIIKLGIEEYSNDQVAKFTLENTEVQLGFFNGMIIEQFNLANGTECGLWEYLAYKNIHGRINLYLYSAENEGFSEKLDELWRNEKTEEDNSSEEDDVVPSKKRKVLNNISNNLNDSTTAHVDSVQSKPFDIEEKSNVRNSQPSRIGTAPKESSCNLQTAHIGTSSFKDDTSVALEALLQLSNCSETKNNNTIVQVGNLTKNENKNVLNILIPHLEKTVPMQPSNVATTKIFERNFRTVDVYYAVVSTSKYTKEKLFSDQDKSSIFYNDFQNSDNFFNVDKENFDPADNGYDISKVIIDQHEVLSMNYDVIDPSRFCRTYTFPQLEKVKAHTIAYDIDETVGSYDDYLGIGVIVTCLQDCKPEFTWYCNNVMHKKSKMGFWLQIPKSSIDTEWYCSVTCKEKGILESKKILIKANILENSTVSEVQRSEFTMETFIAAGTTASIFKGKFSNITVAVKSIKVYPRYKRLIDREISVLKKIKHDNIIQLMAYCKEEKQVYLIMEYFDGINLHDLIFDDDLKRTYVFDKDRKDSIFLQLSTAIKYLHGQSNPIIHKDIKSENILISLSGKVKLCDFGLSKFSIMMTTLQSTCNSKLMGTKMYMAPEIILHKRDATEKSDIWSLACTILEIYKEDVIWDVESEDQLITALTNNTLPDIHKVPNEYKDIIQRCFSYERTNRPSAVEIVTVLNDVYMRTIRMYQH